MKNEFVSLAVKLAAVMVVVLLLSRVNDSSTGVLAGQTASLLVSDVKVGRGPADIILPTQEDLEEEEKSVRDVAENQSGNTNDGCEATGPDMSAEEIVAAAVTTPPAGIVPAQEGSSHAKSEENASAADTTGETEAVSGPEVTTEVTPGPEVTTEVTPEPEVTTEVTPGPEVTSGATPEPEITPDANDETLYAGLSELEAAELHAQLDPEYKKTAEYISALLVTHPDHYDEEIVSQALSIPTESNDARYEFLTGKGYKPYVQGDMPSGYRSDSQAQAKMVTFDVPVWKISSKGNRYSSIWSITINEKLASSVRCIFSDIYLLDVRFPFNYLKGYLYRKVGGSGLMACKLMSIHAFGAAIDINYRDPDNDYYLGKGNDLRDKSNPYCIPDEVIAVFESYGWFWGGNFDICADTMHFQYLGLEFLQYDSDEPLPILYRGAENMNPVYITNLSQRLVKLGYLEKETSKFSKKLDAALKVFQTEQGLEPDGIADYETWVPLINATHDMSYVF